MSILDREEINVVIGSTNRKPEDFKPNADKPVDLSKPATKVVWFVFSPEDRVVQDCCDSIEDGEQLIAMYGEVAKSWVISSNPIILTTEKLEDLTRSGR